MQKKKNFLGNFYFFTKKSRFFGRFSAFYGQHSVTAAWATRSPWSIIIHETLVVLIFSIYGPISPAVTFGRRSWKFHGIEAGHWFIWLFCLSAGTMVVQGFCNQTLAIKSRKNMWANKISASGVILKWVKSNRRSEKKKVSENNG